MRQNEPFDLLELYPADSPDYMVAAWLGCIRWALGEEDVMAQFRRETGTQWTPGRSGLERMIDKVTGADEQFFRQFVAWVNVNLWGEVTR